MAMAHGQSSKAANPEPELGPSVEAFNFRAAHGSEERALSI